MWVPRQSGVPGNGIADSPSRLSTSSSGPHPEENIFFKNVQTDTTNSDILVAFLTTANT